MYALALPALVAIAGVGFDYARLAAMDSELQNAADQAALAAATQLDKQSGAIARATSVAQGGLVSNRTLFANDGGTRNVDVPSVTFYASKSDAETCNGGELDPTDADSDSQAAFVCVTVATRTANYALTPVIAVFQGTLNARAVAGLGSAVCKTPPVMICNPKESTDPDFTVADYVGKGLNLVSVGSGSGTWAPGNFGYLDNNNTANGAPGLREALGWTSVPGDCSPGSGIDTKPGASVSVTDALNTRFDIYDSNVSCPTGGTCPPSANSVKDLIKTDGTNGNACRIHNQGWQESSHTYLPSTADPCSATHPCTTTGGSNYPYPDVMGYPRDICHAISANGSCTDGKVGDGVWDVDAYFYASYGHATHSQWAAAVATGTDPITVSGGSPPYGVTRYDVYKWEMANAGTATINGVTVLAPRTVSGNGGNALKTHGAPYCSTPGVTPGGNTPDRRRLSMAVVNCTANSVNGSSTNVPVQKWVDFFFVQPSFNRASGRTSDGDIYVEVIGETSDVGDGTAGQVVRRDVPYLIK